MSTKTTNYEFIKPEKTDPANITTTNENWDKLDAELAKKYDADNKPTAEDVGAVPKIKDSNSGDYIPEDVKIVKDMPVFKLLNRLAPKGSALTLEHLGTDQNGKGIGGGIYLFVDANNYIGIRLNPITFTTSGNPVIKGNEVEFRVNGTAYKFYGEHNRPYSYSTTDLTPGQSQLATGEVYFVYE